MVDFIEEVIGYKLNEYERKFIEGMAKLDKDYYCIPIRSRSGVVKYLKLKRDGEYKEPYIIASTEY